MNEKQTTAGSIRPTMKQRDLLQYITEFITEHGYSPSYREIMSGLDYNSVATVALHVNSLIKRGHLRKRDRSARSLEVVEPGETSSSIKSNQVKPGEEKWLVEKVEHFFQEVENGAHTLTDVDRLYVLVGALKVLGLDGAAQSFVSRLSSLKKASESD
ncbi:MAG TPA: hypothetical protein VMR28_02545 [Candidatus Saccharimonadales bacterium]|nr:hypothetical protein [Candidatus Saccharimonadales bacterium]